MSDWLLTGRECMHVWLLKVSNIQREREKEREREREFGINCRHVDANYMGLGHNFHTPHPGKRKAWRRHTDLVHRHNFGFPCEGCEVNSVYSWWQSLHQFCIGKSVDNLLKNDPISYQIPHLFVVEYSGLVRFYRISTLAGYLMPCFYTLNTFNLSLSPLFFGTQLNGFKYFFLTRIILLTFDYLLAQLNCFKYCFVTVTI